MDKLNYANKRCLIVEDKRSFSIILKQLLSSLGAKKINTELSAESALKACNEVPYDLIVCDLHLGSNRKNGFEFLEEIRTCHLIEPSAVFIMISGDSARSMVLGSIEKQPDDYLIKPFSQAQLNARITRAHSRRTALASLYGLVEHKKYELSIEACQRLLDNGTKYKAHCNQVLVQIYWAIEQYDQAEQLLQQLLDERTTQWALSAMARTQLLKNNVVEAITLAKQAIDALKNDVDSYDTLAKAYLSNNMPEQALVCITDALRLSPLSIERHYSACNIARANNDYEAVIGSSKAIYELSQNSVHRSINHMCSYIRSILDAAEHAENKNDSNRLKHEALFALEKIKININSPIMQNDFDFYIFEGLIHARLSFMDNRHKEAKIALEESQIKIEKKFTEFPLSLAAESIRAMLDLGDYEEAIKVKQIVDVQNEELDSNLKHSISSIFSKQGSKQVEYAKHNKNGLASYSEGKYHNAYESFTKAKALAPMNIGVKLNLLQCIIKLIHINDDEHISTQLQKEGAEHYHYINDMPLRNVYQQKFDSMKLDAENALLL